MGDGFTAMLDVLREQRARRALWAEAWPLAVSAALKMTTDRVDRNALFLALNATAGAWRAAYEGTPATAGERAVTRLAEAVLPVAEAVTDGQRAALAQRLHDGGANYSQIAKEVGGHRSTIRASLMYEPRPPRPTCSHGHPLEGENLYVRPSDGARMCRACGRARRAERQQAAQAATG